MRIALLCQHTPMAAVLLCPEMRLSRHVGLLGSSHVEKNLVQKAEFEANQPQLGLILCHCVSIWEVP